MINLSLKKSKSNNFARYKNHGEFSNKDIETFKEKIANTPGIGEKVDFKRIYPL